MKTLSLIAIGVSALAVTACVRPFGAGHHRPLHPVSRLDCPQKQGPFDRASAAADGKSCDYTGPDGAKVQLTLVTYAGEPESALAPIEARMRSLLPAPSPTPTPTPPAVPASASAAKPAGGEHDNVDIDLPGISIHADDKNAKVHVGGMHIDADGQNNSVKINGGRGPTGGRGQFTVDANDSGAVIRSRSFGANVEQSLVVASKTPGPEGWRTVAYEAVGPKGGPLVVANFQSKADDHDPLFEQAKALAWKAARRSD